MTEVALEPQLLSGDDTEWCRDYVSRLTYQRSDECELL